jgi:hypothetical protein
MDDHDRRNWLIFGAVIAFLVIGWWVVSALERQRTIEDCLMSRRPNCQAYVDGP